MRCLRCNRETTDNQVFCDECLAQMKTEPIKPGTPVNLVKRPPSVPREPLQPQIRPEEQFAHLEHRISRLHRWIAALVILAMLFAGILGWTIWHSDDGFAIGQNYTPMTTVEPTGK